jgi:hypothetical protein
MCNKVVSFVTGERGGGEESIVFNGLRVAGQVQENVLHLIDLFEKSCQKQQFSVWTILLSFLIILFCSNVCKLLNIQNPAPAEFSSREFLRLNEVVKQLHGGPKVICQSRLHCRSQWLPFAQ